MKYILSSLLALSLLGFLSCVKQTPPSSTQQREREAQAPVFQTLESTETILSEREINGEKPQVAITLSLLAVEAAPEVRTLIYQTLYNGKEPSEYKNNLIAGWKAEYEGLWNGIPEEEQLLATFSGEYDEAITVPFQHQRVLVLKQDIYEYTGGAHGNSDVQFFVFDLEQNRLVELADILTADARSPLKNLLEEALRDQSQQGAEPPAADEDITDRYWLWEGYWESREGLPENFFLTAEGLGIYWNPYEIAPYAVGPSSVTLPYAAVEALLGAEGRALISTVQP